jgi:hypothetical protein
LPADDVWPAILDYVKVRSDEYNAIAQELIERLVLIEMEMDFDEEEHPNGLGPEIVRNYAVLNDGKFEACALRVRIQGQEEIGLYFEITEGKISKYCQLSESGISFDDDGKRH